MTSAPVPLAAQIEKVRREIHERDGVKAIGGFGLDWEACRGLDARAIAEMTEESAFDLLLSIRWGAQGSRCPYCGCAELYFIAESGRMYKCKSCKLKFSNASGTLLAYAKKDTPRHYLCALAMLFSDNPVSFSDLASLFGDDAIPIIATASRILRRKAAPPSSAREAANG